MQTELLVKAAKVFLSETKKQHLHLNLGESTYVLKEVSRLELAFNSHESLTLEAIRNLIEQTTNLGDQVTKMLKYSDCLKA